MEKEKKRKREVGERCEELERRVFIEIEAHGFCTRFCKTVWGFGLHSFRRVGSREVGRSVTALFKP